MRKSKITVFFLTLVLVVTSCVTMLSVFAAGEEYYEVFSGVAGEGNVQLDRAIKSSDDSHNYQLYDGNINDTGTDRWYQANPWVAIDLGKRHFINKITLFTQGNASMKLDNKIAFSNNASDFADVANWVVNEANNITGAQDKLGAGAEESIVSFSQPTAGAYRYIKMLITPSEAPPWNSTILREIKILGKVDPTDVASPAPTNFVATPNSLDSSITLSWNDVAGSSYQIFQNNVKLADVAAGTTSYKVSDLFINTNYKFSIKAIKDSVASESALVDAVIDDVDYKTNVVLNKKIINISSVDPNWPKIQINDGIINEKNGWYGLNDVGKQFIEFDLFGTFDITEFKIFKRKDNDLKPTNIFVSDTEDFTGAVAVATFADNANKALFQEDTTNHIRTFKMLKGTVSGRFVRLEVQNQDQYGAGVREFEVYGKKTANVEVGVEIPTNLAVAETTTKKVKLTWNSVPNATEYRVYRSIKDNTLYGDAHYAVVTAPTFEDTDVRMTAKYFYKITAYNANAAAGLVKESLASSEVNSTVLNDATFTNVASITDLTLIHDYADGAVEWIGALPNLIDGKLDTFWGNQKINAHQKTEIIFDFKAMYFVSQFKIDMIQRYVGEGYSISFSKDGKTYTNEVSQSDAYTKAAYAWENNTPTIQEFLPKSNESFRMIKLSLAPGHWWTNPVVYNNRMEEITIIGKKDRDLNPDEIVVGTPQNTTITANEDGSVLLNWNAVTDATKYEVYGHIIGGEINAKIMDVTTNTATITNIPLGTKCSFYVIAYINTSSSLQGETVTATTKLNGKTNLLVKTESKPLTDYFFSKETIASRNNMWAFDGINNNTDRATNGMCMQSQDAGAPAYFGVKLSKLSEINFAKLYIHTADGGFDLTPKFNIQVSLDGKTWTYACKDADALRKPAINDTDNSMYFNFAIAQVANYVRAEITDYSTQYGSCPSIFEFEAFGVERADTIAPVIPSIDNVPAFAVSGEYTLPEINATDDIMGNILVKIKNVTCADNNSVTFTPETFNADRVGVYTVTVFATDGANEVTKTFTVTVTDTVAPIIETQAEASCNKEDSSTMTILGAIVTDNSGETLSVVITLKIGNGNKEVKNVGDVITFDTVGQTYTLEYTATDSSGNTVTKTFIYTVVADSTAPVLTVATPDWNATTKLINSSITLPTATATDNKTAANAIVFEISYTLNAGAPIALTNGAALLLDNVGAYIISFVAVDEAGNKSTITTFTVNVNDTIAPIISATNITKQVGAQITLTMTDANITATDNLDGNITEYITILSVKLNNTDITFANNTFTLRALGVYTVTLTVSDEAGNDCTKVWTVTSVDTTKPSIEVTIPQNLTVNEGAEFTFPVATVSDNFDTDLAVTLQVKFGDKIQNVVNNKLKLTQVGTYVVTYSTKDLSENIADVVTFSIVVKEVKAPVITVVAPKLTGTVGDEFTLNTATSEGATITLTVTLKNENITVANNKFTATKEGTYVVTYTAVKDGKQTVKTFDIVVSAAKTGCGSSMATQSSALGIIAIIFMGLVVIIKTKQTKKD